MPGFLQKILSAVFPALCISCGKKLESASFLICGGCTASLEKLGEFVCSSCGKRITGKKCHTGSIAVFSAFRYESEPVKKLIHALKYGGTESAAKTIARLVEPIFKKALLKSGAVKIALIPVPLFSSRERRRGFNQSLLFADALSSLLMRSGIIASVFDRVLRRIRDTKSQTVCKTRKERADNVSGCFKIADGFRFAEGGIGNQLVFLVDDVVTSGATMEEAARTLRKAGVPRIAGLCIAKT